MIINGTSSAGLTGHAGIALSSTTILHIAGARKTPTTITKSQWNSSYSSKGWTKVYRSTNSTAAANAASWASKTYKGSNATYKITMDLSTTNETYCSKLVWPAYYYGAGTSHANGPTWGIRLPYQLNTTIKNLSEQGTIG